MSGIALDPEIEAFMRAGAGVSRPADLVKETPIAMVFLLDGVAFKLKKPVDFGFVDYSTLDKRCWAVERELSFNRRCAGDIYRAMRPVLRAADGGLRLGDDEAEGVLEWALEMRRFDEASILAYDPARVEGDFAERLGRQVARMHAQAEVALEGGGVGALGFTIGSNAEQLRSLAGALGADEVEALIAETAEAFARFSPLLEVRRQAGLARHCHGDLHLANIVVENGRTIPFDCIEFNDRLSRIDVLYDTAFLVMDLLFRGQAAGANRVLNGWFDEAAREDGVAAHLCAGLEALPLFLSVRAAVRAHVSGHADLMLARAYLAAARDHLAPKPPVLHAVGGLSGSGKSTYARCTAPTLGAGAGAVVLRSDEIRKRLWGHAPTDRLPPQAYAASESPRVYGVMMDEARRTLKAGAAVVLDAVFLRPEERAAAHAVAVDAGVAFDGVWLDVPAEVAAARIAGRTDDASDADAAVLAQQLTRDPGPLGEGWRLATCG